MAFSHLVVNKTSGEGGLMWEVVACFVNIRETADIGHADSTELSAAADLKVTLHGEKLKNTVRVCLRVCVLV